MKPLFTTVAAETCGSREEPFPTRLHPTRSRFRRGGTSRAHCSTTAGRTIPPGRRDSKPLRRPGRSHRRRPWPARGAQTRFLHHFRRSWRGLAQANPGIEFRIVGGSGVGLAARIRRLPDSRPKVPTLPPQKRRATLVHREHSSRKRRPESRTLGSTPATSATQAGDRKAAVRRPSWSDAAWLPRRPRR